MLNAPGSTFPSPAIEDAAVAAPQADWGGMGLSEHFVQFYDADGALVDAVAGFIAAALRAGDVGIVIATAAHRRGIEERLSAKGLDLAEARDRGRYVALDATETLASFLVDEIPDPARFTQVVGGIVARAAQGGRRVRAFGEMVSLLALEGNHAAALRLEELWNDLQAHHSFALFCAYPMASLAGPALTEAFGEVCAQHARVIPAENYTALPTPDDRFRAIVRWQQKAESLETALAAELAARQEAEAALRLRDEFLLIASHELKTPLTTLSGHAQMALRQLEREGHLEPKRAVRSLETIREQAGKLSRLIAQLLDVSRLETGRLVLERTPTDLTGLVEQVVFAARVLSERHTITVTAPKSLEAWGDPLRLEQALAHLLENAVKYGPEGGQIDVVLARDGSETVQIAVRDRGPGIPMRMRARLFERFHQAHPNDHQGGMGLGLYISRQIVELHGGSIRAEFPPDGGTRFVVSLPIQ